MFTGATSEELEPMKAPSPMRVLIFEEAVVIAGDGPGADVGVGADFGVAEIGEVADLGAGAQCGGFDLDEIADLGAGSKVRSGPQTREGPDMRAGANPRAFDARKCVNMRAVGDLHAGAENDMRLDQDVAAQLRVGVEKNRLRRDQRGSVDHRGAAQPVLRDALPPARAARGR